MFDVAVIGAGMAGLVCAQQLSQAGYSVVVVEKSRGLGGRVATRRLYRTCADHGACYLKPKGELLGRFVELLCERNVLEVWTDKVYQLESNSKISNASRHPAGTPTANNGGNLRTALAPQDSALTTPRYVAPAGMSAIAKFLASGLEIWLNQRVQALTPTTNNNWHLTLEPTNADATTKSEELTAKAVVVAIPAPQALMLLEPLGASLLSPTFLDNLRSVEFNPSLSVIAGYPTDSQPLPEWKAISFVDDAVLGWVGFDSTKRPDPQQPVFVVQSSANFAQLHLESQDLHAAGEQILNRAAELLLPWLVTPDWIQVHRWRYAFPSRPWHEAFLSAETKLPLVCCGDWCGGNQIEAAMFSGASAAEQINIQLRHLALPQANLFKYLAQ